MVAGIFLGILIGTLTSIVALLLLRSANAIAIKNISSLIKITSQILAIPTFWVGGGWLGKGILRDVIKDENMINSYIASLAIIFLSAMLYPMYKWIIKLAGELGQETRRS